MAKIIVYEDHFGDLVMRYGRLTRKHDVHVQFFHESYHKMKSQLEKRGFTNHRPSFALEDADLHFVDGLEGRGLDIMQKLPKDKAYFVSENPSLRADAHERGYNVANHRDIEAIVDELEE